MYTWIKDIPKYVIKKGMTISYNTEEDCYTVNELPWMFSPLIKKEDIKFLLKEKYIKRSR